jgi:hypothetical protein
MQKVMPMMSRQLLLSNFAEAKQGIKQTQLEQVGDTNNKTATPTHLDQALTMQTLTANAVHVHL